MRKNLTWQHLLRGGHCWAIHWVQLLDPRFVSNYMAGLHSGD